MRLLSWEHAPWSPWIPPISLWEGFTFFYEYFWYSEADVWTRCVKIEAARSRMTAMCMWPWDWHVQYWLGTSISRYLLHCVVHCLHLALGGPSWYDSYWIGLSWMGQAWQQVLFPGGGWELVRTCGLEPNNLCKVLASGLWHVWCLSKDKLHGLIWCEGSGSSYLTDRWLNSLPPPPKK